MFCRNFVFVALTSILIEGMVVAMSGCSNNSDNCRTPAVVTPQTTAATGDYKKVDSVNIKGIEYDIVTFGLWPQTLIAAGVTVNKATCEKEEHGTFIYCKGSDGEWYVEQVENACESGYKYSDGNTTVGQGGTSKKWFKVEPIKWRALTGNYSGNKLLLAESILTGGVEYYPSAINRTIGLSTVYPNNYKYSTIRAWLNGKYEVDDTQERTYTGKGFLQSAFTKVQQASILDITVDNSARSTNPAANAKEFYNGVNQYACVSTRDKIFLLSEQEVTTNAYGFEIYSEAGVGNKRIRTVTDFAKATGAYQNSTVGMGGWWWLRSPGTGFGLDVRNINKDGYGNGTPPEHFKNINAGIVPALCISN